MHYYSYCEKDEFLMGCVANTVVALWSAVSYAEEGCATGGHCVKSVRTLNVVEG